MDIERLVAEQRAYFETGATLPYAFRADALRRLDEALRTKEALFLEALHADLRKAPMEGYMTELGLVLEELSYAQKHLKRWMRPRHPCMPLSQFPSRGILLSEPYGVALILSPWNYPLQLSLAPLVGALAAGNCAVLKPSRDAPETSRLLRETVAELFDPCYVAVVEGGREENQALFDQQFDYIFFTGGATVGRIVLEKAAKHLTPVSLELGGKSPVIVDETADIALTAKRIVFGKLLNAGQTCVAPDYVLVRRERMDALVDAMRDAITGFLGDAPLLNPEWPAIVNARHFERLCGLMKGVRVACGGGTDAANRLIAPTILTDVAQDSPCMGEEIFGPLLPVIPFDTLDDAIRLIRARPKPLALYLFTRDRAARRRVLREVSFGGGCVNDAVIHVAVRALGFGGVGESGMGSYHGKRTFDTFSHEKGVVDKALWLDLPMRYHPYTASKERIVRRFLK